MNSSLIEYSVKKALCHIFFSGERVKLVTYTYMRTNEVDSKKYKSLRGLTHFKIYLYSLFGRTAHTHTHTHTHTYTYIYIYVYVYVNSNITEFELF